MILARLIRLGREAANLRHINWGRRLMGRVHCAAHRVSQTEAVGRLEVEPYSRPSPKLAYRCKPRNSERTYGAHNIRIGAQIITPYKNVTRGLKDRLN